VGVIHQHRWGRGRAGRAHPLHASGHPPEAGQPLQQLGQGQLLLHKHAHGLQQVHQVEPAHQRRAEAAAAGGGVQRACHALRTHLQVADAQLGPVIAQGAAPAGNSLRQQPLRQLAAPGVIHVHHGAAAQQRLAEQQRLGLEIGLHRGVVIEVVLGEVGEHRAGEAAAGHPLLIERVGAHLHRSDVGAGGHRLGQLALQQIGKSGGVLGGDAVTRPAIDQRAEQGGGPAGAARQVFDQMGGGGLAVGARHAEQLEALAGMAPEGGGQFAGEPAQLVGGDHEHARLIARRAFPGGFRTDQGPGGAGGQHLRPVGPAIDACAGQAHEQTAVADAA